MLTTSAFALLHTAATTSSSSTARTELASSQHNALLVLPAVSLCSVLWYALSYLALSTPVAANACASKDRQPVPHMYTIYFPQQVL
jgi:hypothetical protein